jgi:hypothetical protein
LGTAVQHFMALLITKCKAMLLALPFQQLQQTSR